MEPRRVAPRRSMVVAALLVAWLGAPRPLAAAEQGVERLPNGMSLITIVNSAPTVSVRLMVRAGGRDDPRGLEGLAHYVEHLIASEPGTLSGGSTDRGASRLRAHGPANAFTSLNRTVYAMEVAPQALEAALEALAKRIAFMDAGDAIAAREQNVVRQEYFWRYGNTPRWRLRSQVEMRLGMSDPELGWNIGTPETIARLDLEAARAFWRQHYAPQAMTLVLSGALDRAAAKVAAQDTLGTIAPRSLDSGPPVAVRSPRPSTIAQSLASPNGSDPAVEHRAFFDLSALDQIARMRTLAAITAVRPALAGGHRSAMGVARSILDADPDARTIDVWLYPRDARWLELGIYLEASTPAARTRLLGALQARIASLKPDDLPTELLEDCRSEGDRTWVNAADAPHADSVVGWLSLGFTLQERAPYRAALKVLGADEISELIRRLARPTLTATGELDPTRE